MNDVESELLLIINYNNNTISHLTKNFLNLKEIKEYSIKEFNLPKDKENLIKFNLANKENINIDSDYDIIKNLDDSNPDKIKIELCLTIQENKINERNKNIKMEEIFSVLIREIKKIRNKKYEEQIKENKNQIEQLKDNNKKLENEISKLNNQILQMRNENNLLKNIVFDIKNKLNILENSEAKNENINSIKNENDIFCKTDKDLDKLNQFTKNIGKEYIE